MLVTSPVQRDIHADDLWVVSRGAGVQHEKPVLVAVTLRPNVTPERDVTKPYMAFVTRHAHGNVTKGRDMRDNFGCHVSRPVRWFGARSTRCTEREISRVATAGESTASVFILNLAREDIWPRVEHVQQAFLSDGGIFFHVADHALGEARHLLIGPLRLCRCFRTTSSPPGDHNGHRRAQ